MQCASCGEDVRSEERCPTCRAPQRMQDGYVWSGSEWVELVAGTQLDSLVWTGAKWVELRPAATPSQTSQASPDGPLSMEGDTLEADENPLTPPGWYRAPDQDMPGVLRYWDGHEWTEHQIHEGQLDNPAGDAMTDTAPPGWYPNPSAPEDQLRYWDGNDWTDHYSAGHEDVAATKQVDYAQMRAEQRQLKAAEKAERKRQKAAKEAADRKKYGEKLADEIFAGRTVRIYSRGYIRVSWPLLGARAPYERLFSIEASADVSKKTGVGRAGAAVLTGGNNLLLTGNRRGDLYLTIATDFGTRVLHTQDPSSMYLKAMKRLEAVGNSVIR